MNDPNSILDKQVRSHTYVVMNIYKKKKIKIFPQMHVFPLTYQYTIHRHQHKFRNIRTHYKQEQKLNISEQFEVRKFYINQPYLILNNKTHLQSNTLFEHYTTIYTRSLLPHQYQERCGHQDHFSHLHCNKCYEARLCRPVIKLFLLVKLFNSDMRSINLIFK